MHSKDKTLIASLGFSDPDKGELHDRACFFCTTEAFAAVMYEELSAVVCEELSAEFFIRGYTAQLEHPIKEGYGIVGFADVFVTFDLISVHPCARCKAYRSTGRSKKFKVLIEVKTRVEAVGNWVRQINLYRAKMVVDLAILACVQVIPDIHQAYLRQANIIPLTFKGMCKDAKLNRKLPTCKCYDLPIIAANGDLLSDMDVPF